MSNPGIEPGSSQPQCEILTTVRIRPIKFGHFLIHEVVLCMGELHEGGLRIDYPASVTITETLLYVVWILMDIIICGTMRVVMCCAKNL